jgi:hypothetical protein
MFAAWIVENSITTKILKNLIHLVCVYKFSRPVTGYSVGPPTLL